MQLTEPELSKRTIKVLSKNFIVLTERVSKCGAGRIDLVLICKKSDAKFGIELKSTERKKGETVGEIVKQCIRYAKYEFMVEDGLVKNNSRFERLPIFLCPALSNNILAWVDSRVEINGVEHIVDRHDTSNKHHGINGMLGSFGVGELRTFKWNYNKTKRVTQYYSLIMSNSVIWTSKKDYNTGELTGLMANNYDKLILKINKL